MNTSNEQESVSMEERSGMIRDLLHCLSNPATRTVDAVNKLVAVLPDGESDEDFTIMAHGLIAYVEDLNKLVEKTIKEGMH